MSGPEQTYCRSPLAKEVNKSPGHVWMATHNTGMKGTYDSGFPDGIIAHLGQAASAAERQLLTTLSCQMLCYSRLKGKGMDGIRKMSFIECKANYGKIEFNQWRESQRNWYDSVGCGEGLVVRLLVWVYPSHTEPKRHDTSKATLFLVSPEDWRDLETKTDRVSMALSSDLEREHAYKDANLLCHWAEKIVTFPSLIAKLEVLK